MCRAPGTARRLLQSGAAREADRSLDLEGSYRMSITLGAATQANLLALQNVNSQLDTTQNALATGLKVSSAVDDAVKFFESQSLTNRANDLSGRKDAIDQGISSVTTASQGIQSAIAVLQQMQGILTSAKT